MKPHFALLSMVCILAAGPALANTHNTPEQRAEAAMKRMDANGDSQISKEEHAAYSSQKFTEADTNKDSMVSLAELTEHKRKEKGDAE